jgi:hypothetical protein
MHATCIDDRLRALRIILGPLNDESDHSDHSLIGSEMTHAVIYYYKYSILPLRILNFSVLSVHICGKCWQRLSGPEVVAGL